MTWLTKWAFNNKAAIILLVILTLSLGVMSYFLLPKEFLPSADNPMVTVIVTGQGTDADTVSRQVTEPVEKAVASVKGKKNVFSVSGDGFSKVDIVLDSSADIKEAKAQVQEAVNTLPLPEGFAKPVISQLNFDMIPLWQVGVTLPGGTTGQNMEKVEKDVIPRFQGISGIADVKVYGKKETQVVVTVDQKKLEQAHLPMQALLGVLQGKNISAAVGEETIDGKKANIKVVGTVDGKKELEELPITPELRLKDVATVSERSNNDRFITRINGEEAIVLLMFKESHANAVATGKQVNETIEKINQDLGPDIQASTLVSFSEFIANSVDSLIQEVLIGALFATVVILLFLRHWRMTFVTVVSIPLSLGLTLFLLKQSGITLNILTLGAVAVSVGRLVDDSIVVIENIFRRAQQGELSKTVIIDATKEVAAAITSSTLTTVAVFLPMALVQSLRELLLPFALTVTYSLLASLFVALTVVPLMSKGLLWNGKMRRYKKPERYMRILNWCLNYKWLLLTASFLVFVGSVGIYFTMPQGAPDASDNDLSVMLEYPNDVPFAKVKAEASTLEKYLREQEGVKDVIAMIGANGEDAQWSEVREQNTADFFVVTEDGADTETLINNINDQQDQYPDAELDVSVVSMAPSDNSTIVIDLVGNDTKQLIAAADKVVHSVKNVKGVEKVTSNQEEVKPVYDIVVNEKKANVQEVIGQVQSLLNPLPIGTVNRDGQETNVLLDRAVHPETQRDLEKITIAVGDDVVPLSSIAKIEKNERPTSVLRKDGDEYVRVEVTVDPKNLSKISQDIERQTSELNLPKGVTLEMGGAASAMTDQFAELFQVMAVSIGIVYFIMVVTFKTLRAPLAILFTLPLAAIGAVLGLLVSGTPVDVGAMVGALLLIGIVVTNAIVLLDRVKQNEQTMTIREALLEAGATRLRPILMTALATIFAMVPLLFGKEEMGALVSKGLAVVVIGGLSVATLLTLVIIPILYELLHFRKAKKERLTTANTMLME